MHAKSFLECCSGGTCAKFRLYVTVDTQSSFDPTVTITEQSTKSFDPVTVVIEPIDAIAFAAIAAFNAIDAVAIKAIFTIDSVDTVDVPTIDSFTRLDAGFDDRRRKHPVKRSRRSARNRWRDADAAIDRPH